MPLISEVRDAAVAHLRASLSPSTRVEAFAGILDSDSLAPRGVQFSEAASLFVAAGEARNSGKDLDLDCGAEFWAFSVARHAARPTLACNAALDLAQRAMLAIHGSLFGLRGVSPALALFLGPVNDEELARAGIWAWELCWKQRVCLEAPCQI